MNELKQFAEYIRTNHLREYVRESIRLLNSIDIPLMRRFKGLTEQQLFDMSIASSEKFLLSIENGTALNEAEANITKWKEDKLEGGLKRQDIQPSDLVLVYAVQKKSLFHFLPGYSSDVGRIEILLQEMEDYYTKVQNEAVNTLADIQRETERALKETEDIFKLMVSAVKDYAIFLVSPEGTIVNWNTGAEKIKGYKAEEIIGKHISVFYSEEDVLAGRPEHNLRKAREYGIYEDTSWRIKKDGSRFWANVIYTPLYSEDKKLRGYVKITRDMTEARRTEEQLQKSNERFMKIFNLNPLPTYITNSISGKFMYVNEAFEKLIQLRKNDIIGHTALELNIVTPETRRDTLKELNGEGRIHNYEIRLRTGNGDIKDILVSSDTIEIDHEVCYLSAMIDITSMKQTEMELMKKTEELARSNNELEQFAYVASHDLQEPLRMINSYVQLLATRYKDKLDQDGLDFINYAVDGSNRMRNLINSLLEYSRVNRVKPFEWINTDAVLDDVLADLSTQVKENDAVIIRGRLPKIYGDATLIGLLFQNLIANAIKFRSEARPEVIIKGEHRGEDYLFSVQDNGIGIPKEYAEKIFVIFQRLHSKEKYPGTGIGLAICKKIVERHGGKITFESQPGSGTTFYFTIKGIKEP
jgi:PAS domain S-box-containing protein